MELVTPVKYFIVQAHGKEWVDMSEHMLKVTNNDKSHRLLQIGISYTSKIFYSTGSW
jgi:hypothetical protein